jgi:hypothetical protein
VIREHSLASWEAMRTGQTNLLVDTLCADPRVTQLVPPEAAREYLKAEAHIGDAPLRARQMAQIVRVALDSKEVAHADAG